MVKMSCWYMEAARLRKTDIYENVVKLLRVSGKTVFEDAGVMPNPTLKII